MKAGAELDECGDPADAHRSAGRLEHSGHELRRGALADPLRP
jgi:hypothetical protein